MAGISKLEVEAYLRRTEELEARATMLSEANAHMSQQAQKADSDAKSFMKQGLDLHDKLQKAMAEGSGLAEQVTLLSHQLEMAKKDTSLVEAQRNALEAEGVASRAGLVAKCSGLTTENATLLERIKDLRVWAAGGSRSWALRGKK